MSRKTWELPYQAMVLEVYVVTLLLVLVAHGKAQGGWADPYPSGGTYSRYFNQYTSSGQGKNNMHTGVDIYPGGHPIWSNFPVGSSAATYTENVGGLDFILWSSSTPGSTTTGTGMGVKHCPLGQGLGEGTQVFVRKEICTTSGHAHIEFFEREMRNAGLRDPIGSDLSLSAAHGTATTPKITGQSIQFGPDGVESRVKIATTVALAPGINVSVRPEVMELRFIAPRGDHVVYTTSFSPGGLAEPSDLYYDSASTDDDFWFTKAHTFDMTFAEGEIVKACAGARQFGAGTFTNKCVELRVSTANEVEFQVEVDLSGNVTAEIRWGGSVRPRYWGLLRALPNSDEFERLMVEFGPEAGEARGAYVTWHGFVSQTLVAGDLVGLVELTESLTLKRAIGWVAVESSAQAGGSTVLGMSVGPNPIIGDTTLSLIGATNTGGRLSVYDLRGRLVDSRIVLAFPATLQLAGGGRGEPAGLSAGVYFLRLDLEGGQTFTEKVVLLR